jgi:NAD(P)-dependent dehydrogenase (short-subunit alcohol dehydrogenase family)
MSAGRPAPRRRAVVTGASRGLGATVSRFLAAEGFDLVLTGRTEAPLERLTRDLARPGRAIVAVAGAIEDPDHRRSIRTEVERRGGGLDLLVNNASELGPSPLPPLVDLPLEAFRRILEVNLVAPLALVQQLADPLARRRGLVVNVSSDAAIGGYPGWGGYGASKAGLDLLSKTLAAELVPRGISVVSVDPGDMRTAMQQAAYPGQDISDRPEPSVTVPFWAWLFGRAPEAVRGRRFLAQGERWEGPP